MWVCLLNKTHICAHMCARVYGGCSHPVCLCRHPTLLLPIGVCPLHPRSLPRPPFPVCLQRHPHNGASRVDVCSPAFYFAHCSVTAARSQLPPLPQRRSFGDIKGKPEKGYLEKRVARQPNTHHPGAPPTQNSVPGLQPD